MVGKKKFFFMSELFTKSTNQAKSHLSKNPTYKKVEKHSIMRNIFENIQF